jgi:hypothetical protein
MKRSHAIGLLLGLGALVGAVAIGCGSNRVSSFDDPNAGLDGGPSLGFGDGGDGKSTACVGLQCQQKVCGGGGDTTVTGTVFAPNGKLPLYNAIVYVPNSQVTPIVKGATCDTCGAVTGDPVVTALSQPDGTFTLKNVPVGKDIPLVIQVGKWRRQVTIPAVAECAETKLTDPELTRLPKNQGEGDMPQIALTTGGCDNLGCMLPKVGIDASELGLAADGPSKAVHVYNGNAQSGAGGPGAANSANAFWSDATTLKKYDMVILSCECEEAREGAGGFNTPSKGTAAFAAMTEYLNAGGRIFTTDYMYTWYKYSPDATLTSATSMRGGAPGGGKPMVIDATFPKGQALSDWLAVVTPGSAGKVTPDYVFGNIISTDPTKSQQWARSGTSGPIPEGPRVFSVNVPVGLPAAQQCGKGVHIDAHVNKGGAGGDSVDATYPKGCSSALKEGEKLLAFFFFDLASCIQNETEAPKPPPVK